jgi:hypothetical protein
LLIGFIVISRPRARTTADIDIAQGSAESMGYLSAADQDDPPHAMRVWGLFQALIYFLESRRRLPAKSDDAEIHAVAGRKDSRLLDRIIFFCIDHALDTYFPGYILSQGKMIYPLNMATAKLGELSGKLPHQTQSNHHPILPEYGRGATDRVQTSGCQMHRCSLCKTQALRDSHTHILRHIDPIRVQSVTTPHTSDSLTDGELLDFGTNAFNNPGISISEGPGFILGIRVLSHRKHPAQFGSWTDQRSFDPHQNLARSNFG